MRRTIVVVVVVLGWNVDPIRSSTGLAGLAVESGSSGQRVGSGGELKECVQILA